MMLQERVLSLTNELIPVFVSMYCTGIAIDTQALEEIERDYIVEKGQLENDIRELIYDFMGTSDYNINSADDMNEVVYSLKVRDKRTWKALFNLGTDERGRQKRVRKYSKGEFAEIIRTQTDPVYKVESVTHCHTCGGSGKVATYKKDGTLSKRRAKCDDCDGVGFIESYSNRIAGLRIKPDNMEAAAAGFSVSSSVYKRILESTNDEKVKLFCAKMVRMSAVKKYLDTFVGGIKDGLSGDGLLRPKFIQTSTRTGRLSSRSPNFQNQPRAKTFPIRKCVVSRYEGGKILEVDHSQLEFRCAVELSGDEQGKIDIANGVDKHQFTADIIGCERQEAKAHTFKPLYGGNDGSDAEKAYYSAFLARHSGIAEWHEKLCDEALRKGSIVIPSGRVLHFPHIERTSWGVTQRTNIVNYPVQAFATADIVPLALRDCHISLTQLQLDFGARSCIINTVHDSVVFDVAPGEEDMITQMVVEVYTNLKKSIKNYFGYDFSVPLDFEIKMGTNWMDMDTVYVSNLTQQQQVA